MVYTEYKKQRIVYYMSKFILFYFVTFGIQSFKKYILTLAKGYKSTSIVECLRSEGLSVTVSGVFRFIKRYNETRTIARHPGSCRPTKITIDVIRIVERQMEADDETTAVQLQKMLSDKGHPLSLQTILNSRIKLGWTYRGSAYCQLIRHQNKVLLLKQN